MLWEQLTPRQSDVCELLCQGCAHREIAERLGISLRTVKSYLRLVYRKLGVPDDRLQYLVLAVALTYERHPELVPRIGLHAETSHTGYTGSRGDLARPIFYRTACEDESKANL